MGLFCLKIKLNNYLCCLLLDQGQVFVWGYGMLGKGPQLEQSSLPTPIPETLFGRNEFTSNTTVENLKAGMYYFLAKTSEY
jgi:hypothetical protein